MLCYLVALVHCFKYFLKNDTHVQTNYFIVLPSLFFNGSITALPSIEKTYLQSLKHAKVL